MKAFFTREAKMKAFFIADTKLKAFFIAKTQHEAFFAMGGQSENVLSHGNQKKRKRTPHASCLCEQAPGLGTGCWRFHALEPLAAFSAVSSAHEGRRAAVSGAHWGEVVPVDVPAQQQICASSNSRHSCVGCSRHVLRVQPKYAMGKLTAGHLQRRVCVSWLDRVVGLVAKKNVRPRSNSQAMPCHRNGQKTFGLGVVFLHMAFHAIHVITLFVDVFGGVDLHSSVANHAQGHAVLRRPELPSIIVVVGLASRSPSTLEASSYGKPQLSSKKEKRCQGPSRLR